MKRKIMVNKKRKKNVGFSLFLKQNDIKYLIVYTFFLKNLNGIFYN